MQNRTCRTEQAEYDMAEQEMKNSTDKTGQTKLDRQNRMSITEQAEQDSKNRTGRTGQQSRTGRTGQAEQDDRTGKAEQDILYTVLKTICVE